MTDLMFEPTPDKPLEKWQKWANLSRIESARADAAERQRDALLAACKKLLGVVEERQSQLNGWYPEAWAAAQDASYDGGVAIAAAENPCSST